MAQGLTRKSHKCKTPEDRSPEVVSTSTTCRPGRPPTAGAVRELILPIAAETRFEYTCILGELKNRGMRSVSRATVVNILREHGFDPGPKLGEGTREEFLRRHPQTLWACDFFTANVWTLQGLVPIFVFFFLHIGWRRVHLAGMTTHPDDTWVKQRARNMALVFAEQLVQPQFLIRDLDSKFTREFDGILGAEGLAVVTVGPRKPNLNAFAKRWVQSMRQECLEHFVICGEAHLRHLVSTYAGYYNQLRPHQARDNLPLDGRKPPVLPLPAPHEIVCDEQLGGLLKSYRRAA